MKLTLFQDGRAYHVVVINSSPLAQAFAYNFDDPYNPTPGENPPVFKPPREGDPVSMSAVAVTKDGTAWFASDPLSTRDPNYGLASFDGKAFHYFPLRTAGVSRARDLIALVRGGYRIRRAAIVDMFPQTYHIESVALLQRS